MGYLPLTHQLIIFGLVVIVFLGITTVCYFDYRGTAFRATNRVGHPHTKGMIYGFGGAGAFIFFGVMIYGFYLYGKRVKTGYYAGRE